MPDKEKYLRLLAERFPQDAAYYPFMAGEWLSTGSGDTLIFTGAFLPYPTGADAAYDAGDRFIAVPLECVLPGEVADTVRAACLRLIKRGVDPSDKNVAMEIGY